MCGGFSMLLYPYNLATVLIRSKTQSSWSKINCKQLIICTNATQMIEVSVSSWRLICWDTVTPSGEWGKCRVATEARGGPAGGDKNVPITTGASPAAPSLNTEPQNSHKMFINVCLTAGECVWQETDRFSLPDQPDASHLWRFLCEYLCRSHDPRGSLMACLLRSEYDFSSLIH